MQMRKKRLHCTPLIAIIIKEIRRKRNKTDSIGIAINAVHRSTWRKTTRLKRLMLKGD